MELALIIKFYQLSFFVNRNILLCYFTTETAQVPKVTSTYYFPYSSSFTSSTMFHICHFMNQHKSPSFTQLPFFYNNLLPSDISQLKVNESKISAQHRLGNPFTSRCPFTSQYFLHSCRLHEDIGPRCFPPLLYINISHLFVAELALFQQVIIVKISIFYFVLNNWNENYHKSNLDQGCSSLEAHVQKK